MAEGSSNGGSAGGGLLDLERELTCSICTDILYQPLTLLDCLHTFCGSCLKEWFKWQATAAAANGRTASPYTCPQCRESVRGTKADWRLTTLLEGFLKANPGRGKTDEEKEEIRQNYMPGEDVLPPVAIPRNEDDSEDERLLAHVRELSMANVDPETARRRAERASRERQRRRQERHRPEGTGRTQQPNSWTARQAERQQDTAERQVEHQPSLRSLLSDSQITSEDVQEEILQSIYQEGLLNDIDIDNLTPQQEEELTERIAEAYRRRQRNRERSRNRDRSRNGDREGPGNRSRQASASAGRADSPARGQSRARSSPPQQAQQQQSRARPPISRPHLFEQTTAGAERSERRSASSTGHHRQRSGSHTGSSNRTNQAARSATDLSQSPSSEDSQRPRPRALSSNNRSTTDPTNMRGDAMRARNQSGNLRPEPTGVSSSRPRSRESDLTRRQTGPAVNTVAPAPPLAAPTSTTPSENTPIQPAVRPVPSASAFAPEPISNATQAPLPHQPATAPSLTCSRCSRPHIETSLHYNCSKCASGHFNLCLQCYRAGQGCHHWFGFGFAATHRFERLSPPGTGANHEPPHILIPRRYTTPSTNHSAAPYPDTFLQEGAFCESCFAYTNDTYWYCEICLQGAWGYCDGCVMRGKHCTHPLLPLAHISARRNPSHDPSKLAFLPLPHLKPHSYLLKPVETYCDICKNQISNAENRFHCYKCEDGDYDICNTCYQSLVATGKIPSLNGPNGWRRCLNSHRMVIVSYTNDGAARITVRDPVGGRRLKDDAASSQLPPASQLPSGSKYLATWSRFPREEDADELAFPRNAEIVEAEDLNEDWSVGVYGGRVGVFPRNHTRRI